MKAAEEELFVASEKLTALKEVAKREVSFQEASIQEAKLESIDELKRSRELNTSLDMTY